MGRFGLMTAVAVLVLVLVSAVPAGAAEGRILIGFPNTTITAPGHYVVIRDLDGGGQSVIVIEADGVTLDLNGFTLTDASVDVISIQGTVAGASRGVTIRNGRIAGGFAGIYANSAAARRIFLEDLVIEGSAERGVLIENAADVVVRNCAIRGTADSGLEVLANGAFPGKIVNNEISDTQNHGIYLHGLAGGIVENNRLFNTGLSGGQFAGMLIDSDGASNADGNRVARNTIMGHAGTWSALMIPPVVDGNLVQENVVRDAALADGLQIDSASSLVIGNVSTGNARTGLHLGGSMCLAELNHLSDNSHYGLQCLGTANAYRNNMTRGSLPSGIDGATCAASTDAGGNIP